MDAVTYADLLRFAKFCLPKDAFAEPGDIVNDAFLRASSDDKETLRREIKYLAVSQRGQRNGFISIDRIGFKDNSLKETSQVCKRCGNDKAFDDFDAMQRGASTFYRTTCKSCMGKRQWQKLKSNPEKHKARLAYRRKNERLAYANKTGKRINDWDFVLDRIKEKVDPEDWKILALKLANYNLLPEELKVPEPIKEVRPWKHQDIEFLYENFTSMQPQQIADKLKRTTQEVTKMLAELDLTN